MLPLLLSSEFFVTVNFTSLTLFIVILSALTIVTSGAFLYSPASVYCDTFNCALKFSSVRLSKTSELAETVIVTLFESGVIVSPSAAPTIE